MKVQDRATKVWRSAGIEWKTIILASFCRFLAQNSLFLVNFPTFWHISYEKWKIFLCFSEILEDFSKFWKIQKMK